MKKVYPGKRIKILNEIEGIEFVNDPLLAEIAILEENETERIPALKEQGVAVIVMTEKISQVAQILNAGAKAVVLEERVLGETIKKVN